MNDSGNPRRPGTLPRVLLLLAALALAALLLTTGFPPGAPDRLPVFLCALILAVLAAARPGRAVAVFAFLFPCAGLLARASGGTEPATWPGVLLAGFLVGWCFRFLYDFESRAEPARPDAPVAALVGVWVLATGIAVARAVTLWAALRRLSGRAVNGEGLPDGIAVRETLFAFAALAGGAAFYFVLRREGRDARRRALSGALGGVALSALAAVFQRAGVLPGESREYWRLVGRLSGGAIDPNSLGMTCALLLLLAFSRALQPGRRRAGALALFLLLACGLALSGSRSGALVAGLGLLLLLASPALPARARISALAGLVAVGGAAILAMIAVGGGGSLGTRIAQSFDVRLPEEFRLSARPLLWRAAGRLFTEHPIVGAGTGAFVWRFPDLLAAESRKLGARDNPGSGYVQALAETGSIGFLVTAVAVAALGAQAIRRLRASDAGSDGPAAGAATLAFAAALLTGSHWLAADVCLLFFLVAAICADDPRAEVERHGEGLGHGPSAPPRRNGKRLLAAALVAYAVGAVAAVLSTASPAETFRYSRRIGFHELERGPGGAYRWTRQRFALWVVPGDPPVRIGLANFGPAGTPITVEARAAGRIAGRRTLAPGTATAFTIAPGSAPGAVTFALDKSVVPRRLGVAGDRRRLGLLSTCSADAARQAR
jgi:O-antigen ligase